MAHHHRLRSAAWRLTDITLTVTAFFILISIFLLSSQRGMAKAGFSWSVGTYNKGDDNNWRLWKMKSGISFSNPTEDQERYSNWYSAKKYVTTANQQRRSPFQLACNKLAVLTPDELAMRLSARPTPQALANFIRNKRQGRFARAIVTPPTISINWVASGCVTPVVDQGDCGCCWAMVAVGAIECQYKLKYGTLINLSEQSLIDCSWPYGNMGCNGGWMTDGFLYVRDNAGINSEANYPFLEGSGPCDPNGAKYGALNPTIYVDIAPGNELSLYNALKKGPVATAIDASDPDFLFYSSGVYNCTTCDGNWPNHGVLIVGYGYDASFGGYYWQIKNTWGTSWGSGGYGKMAFGRNCCGIANWATLPTL